MRLALWSALGLLASPLFSQTQVDVAIAQISVADLDVKANLRKVADTVAAARAAGADICLLPELIDVGFDEILTSRGGHNEWRHTLAHRDLNITRRHRSRHRSTGIKRYPVDVNA